MAGREPEERVSFPLVRQRWLDVSFLHWRYDPAVVEALLPPGLRVDTLDAAAWVSITPFVVDGPTTFPETNVRTYVIGPDGRDGIWFLTLEAASLLVVAPARAFLGVPYRWAAMRVEREGDRTTYRSRRRGRRPVAHRITVDRGGGHDVSEDPTAQWLAGRWRAWTRIAGRPFTIPVEHEPWPLATATLVELDETVLESVGLPPPSGDPVVHASPGVHATLGWPARLR